MTSAVFQGFDPAAAERMPLPPLEALNPAQRAAADALIAGPRKAVFGPFVPLLRTPVLLERVAALGETLRFASGLDARVRELCICMAARHVGNQFEWLMHAPLAAKAGVAPAVLDDVRAGRMPRPVPDDERAAAEFTAEMLAHDGVCDATYAAALAAFGEAGVVELATLAGYFVMVSWLMNVARTPFAQAPAAPPLAAFPA